MDRNYLRFGVGRIGLRHEKSRILPKPEKARFWLLFNNKYVFGAELDVYDEVQNDAAALGLQIEEQTLKSSADRMFLLKGEFGESDSEFAGNIYFEMGSHRIAVLEPKGARNLKRRRPDLSISFLPLQREVRKVIDLSSFAVSPNPETQQLIKQVSEDSLRQMVRDLSGHSTRAATTCGYLEAARSVEDSLKKFKWASRRGDSFPARDKTSFNVVAEKRANSSASQPGLLYLTAHLDTMNEGIIDPGADDNASGCAALLEIARILGERELHHDVRLAFLGAEEYGTPGGYRNRFTMVGSLFHVENLPEDEVDRIRGFLNLDMIAYSGGRQHSMTVEQCSRIAEPIRDQVCEVAATYLPGEIAVEFADFDSDHDIFQKYFLPGLGLTEGGEPNPYRHSPKDTISKLDFGLASKITKVALGWLSLQVL